LSETRKYRKFTAQQKTEIVLASLRGPKTMAELCREHEIADSLMRKWREQFLAAGAERLQGRSERTEVDELRRQVSRLSKPKNPDPTGRSRRPDPSGRHPLTHDRGLNPRTDPALCDTLRRERQRAPLGRFTPGRCPYRLGAPWNIGWGSFTLL
jgi:transposase